MAIRKAIIIGGGPAGLSAALRLHQTTDIECTVYELRPEPATIGGAIGVQSNGLRLFYRLGVYDALLERGSTLSDVVMYSMKGNVLGVWDPVGWAKAKTGFGYIRIKRSDLLDVLMDAVYQAKIPVQFNKRIAAIEETEMGGRGGEGRVTVTFSDGTTDQADLLLGCDGIHSDVRRLSVDSDLKPEYSGFSGLSSIISASELTPSTVKQLSSGFCVTFTEEGMFAATPCTASIDEVFWWFSKEVEIPRSGDSRDGWEVRRKEEVDGFKTSMFGILSGVCGDLGNTVREVVAKTKVVGFYPIYRLPLGRTWSRGRCLLIGDAAHAMQPHAGQGVSMALEDVFLLCRLLKDPKQPLAEVFEEFNRIRRPRVDKIYAMAAHNVNIRKKSGPWGLWMKEMILWLYMWAFWFFGLEKSGYGQKHLVYDIDAEVL